MAELEQATLGLRAVGVRVLIIDELHNVLAGRGDVRREFLNLIRFLGNELPRRSEPDGRAPNREPIRRVDPTMRCERRP